MAWQAVILAEKSDHKKTESNFGFGTVLVSPHSNFENPSFACPVGDRGDVYLPLRRALR
jgi:hypothetical protein